MEAGDSSGEHVEVAQVDTTADKAVMKDVKEDKDAMEEVKEKMEEVKKMTSKAMDKARKAKKALMLRAKEKANLITQSDYFRRVCLMAFEKVDLDGTNSVDFKEVYVAVLMLYLYLGKVVRGLSPPPIKEVRDLIARLDVDSVESKSDLNLDFEEFRALCVILAQNIVKRALTQALISLIMVPVVVTYMLRLYFHMFPPAFPWSWFPSGICATVVSTVVSGFALPPLMDMIQQRSLRSAERLESKKEQ